MMKFKKYVIFIILFVTISFAFINRILADENWSVDTNNTDTGSIVNTNPSEGTPSGNGVGGNYMYTPKGYAYGCTVTASSCTPSYGIYSREVGVGWNLYDLFNNSIINQTNVNSSIIAGTAVGAKLYEYRSATWWAKGFVSTTITCKQRVTYSCPGQCYQGSTTSGPIFVPCTTTCEKEVTFSYGGTSWSSSCQSQANELGYKAALEEVTKDGGSYALSISDPNDARCANPEKYANELKRDGIICNNYEVSAIPGEVTSENGKLTRYYYYEMYGACINAKTGKVRYLNEGDTCNEEEYYIENDNDDEKNRHWHIFTPLNSKSTEGYTLAFTENKATKQRGDICQATVEKYAKNYEYTLYIKPMTGSFTNNVAIDKNMVANGCYFQTIIKVPITQKYYNEEISGSESTLQGFNFYYRPIDVDNPFPNGIASDSYWKIWEENGGKDPDISKSYDEYTYVTNMDEDEIREYNDEIEYTDWSNMNIDGSSQFIQSSQIIIRNGKITNDSFYSLGCGPQNQCEYLDSDHTIENPIYQPECKIIRLGDVCP